MRYLKSSLIFFMIFRFVFTFGQWSVQTGYDLATFVTGNNNSELLGKIENSHIIHRLNGRLEYQFKNNFFLGLNSGIDFHNIQRHLETRGTSIGVSSTIKETSIYHVNKQTFRVGLQIGYNYSINNKSSFCFLIEYGQFFFNKIKIKESLFIDERFLNSELDNNNPWLRTEEHRPMTNLNELGYGNKIKVENRNIVFSIQYRHYFNKFFISPTVGVSPWNNINFGRVGKTFFLFGVNFCYTLPQKNKNNEK